MNDVRDIDPVWIAARFIAWLTGVFKLDGRGGGRLDVARKYHDQRRDEVSGR